MARSTVHYTDNQTNNILKQLHNKLRPAGTPVERVEYIIELLLLRIFEIKLKREDTFKPLRKLFDGENYRLLFSYLVSLPGEQIKSHLNKEIFPFYAQILSHARRVFKKNLPQKVQDSLVLIEEVFANSSFSTNVQSGNMTEIIGLVSEIDEAAILKTDLLGDAIESALSETGGTQDIGLHRTPDHIRQMMVALADPTFEDIIFDPACGTGGFLFDAWHYTLEKVTKDGKWPSQKCPPNNQEIVNYFERYFLRFNEPMPDIDTANRFYKEGISGIEYMGRIRKMAAINLYIRGLNPANIIQGDSLARFDPAIDDNSKTLILSNPPFGAERDQPAYPNVWQEYAKESETTILFVKLIFDLLHQEGRCAVVVSEGFLTRDKASARILRKILLEEANLRAIISLPQGVFVSKNGQGAKTSILYFEKGKPTKWTWYYKIENDGFSMGINREPIPGCQIPEVIELFTKYVKKDKIPPKTKNSFVTPVDWIKTLDPRLKARIKKETKKQIEVKRFSEKEKLIERLKNRKRKITDEEFKKRLERFDLVTENKIQNKISKRIEKAHQYSFNLQTYRSDLTNEQIKDWKETLKDIKPQNDSTIDERYQLLKETKPETALRILASFNPENVLEMDIAKEYLQRNQEKHAQFKTLFNIIKESRKFPFISLSKVLTNLSPERKFILDESKVYCEPTISTKTNIISVKNEAYGKDLKVKKRILIKEGDLVIGLLHTQNGAFGISDKEYASTGTFIPFKINTDLIDKRYLLFMLKKALCQLSAVDATGRENYKVEQILDLKIPFPPFEIQKQIVEKIEKQKTIIEGAEKVLEGWEISIKGNWPEVFLGNIAEIIMGQSPESQFYNEDKEGLPFYQGKIEFGDVYIQPARVYTKKISRVAKQENILMSVRAPVGPVNIASDKCCIGRGLAAIRVKNKEVIFKYVFFYLKSIEKHIGKNVDTGAIFNSIGKDEISSIKIPLPPLKVQRQIVNKLNNEIEALEKVKMLKEKAEKRIEEILEEVWGERNDKEK